MKAVDQATMRVLGRDRRGRVQVYVCTWIGSHAFGSTHILSEEQWDTMLYELHKEDKDFPKGETVYLD